MKITNREERLKMKKMNEFTKIAKYIHSESPEPISEIEWLLKEYYKNDKNKLITDYKDVL